MAELILSSRGPHQGPGAESYFDFEPGNLAMLEAIETLLACRSGNPVQHEADLAELCAKSAGDGAKMLRRATLFGWIGILGNLTRSVRNSSDNSRPRRRLLSKKSGNGRSSPGIRRRFSIA